MKFFPYEFVEDLPRYRYARHRFIEMNGCDARLWPIKMLHDILQQACANATFLCVPVLLAVMDEHPVLSAVECVGYALWLCGWIFESVADMQKVYFELLQARHADRRQVKPVLGFTPPFDGLSCIFFRRLIPHVSR